MAFWGVEVKPGKPYTHIHDNIRGVLRLSQATLGNGEATKRSVLQCNVGNKSPVILCALLPDRLESTCLDLQFEESEEVIFSVVGPRSVHLAGFFIGGSFRRGGGEANDSDSYGEDIWETGSEESGSHGSEDKYESDFIDDGDIEMAPSPRHSSGVVIEGITDKPVNENRTRRRLRKKYHVSDPDEGDVGSNHQIVVNHNKLPVFESEEEDGFPISFSTGKKDKEKNLCGDGEIDCKIMDADKKTELHVVKDKDSEREDKVATVSSEKSKKKKKDKTKLAKSIETDAGVHDETIRDRQSEDQNTFVHDKKYQAQPCERENGKINQDHVHEMGLTETSGKRKKRKKEKVRRGDTPGTRVSSTVDKFEEGTSTEKIDTEDNIEQANIGNNGKDLLVENGHQDLSDEKEIAGSSNRPKRKKKKAKATNSLNEENESAETSRKDRNDKNATVKDIKKEPSNSQQKIGEDQPADGLSLQMTTNVHEGPVLADFQHEPNKKKQKRKSR